MRRSFPLAYPGMKIGLFGGSFDPAHEGHAHVAETALKRLGLDRVWWLVSPQNPLKPASSPFKRRMKSAREQARGPRMVVTNIERRLGSQYTYQTLRALKRHYPGVLFVMVMGADNITNFRKWLNWREVAKAAPVAVIALPGASPADRLNTQKDWVFINARLHPQSSTALRRATVAKARRK